MSLTISRQMKAARALIGWEQKDLAEAAGVAINTIRRMEAGDGPIKANAETLRKVERAFIEAGLELLNHGAPGVRIRPASTS
ncbi:helix-turn-helix domain-containing protein [Azospirillum tabaci]|uniref:helix-turn-helix domain-containing protein n=1 Tax=Azospirillum tabaci TaxID=2752310 RepID=UPI0016605A14|nr:helix-turn-helix domain-containing protein [Azospirillum tabaci]